MTSERTAFAARIMVRIGQPTQRALGNAPRPESRLTISIVPHRGADRADANEHVEVVSDLEAHGICTTRRDT